MDLFFKSRKGASMRITLILALLMLAVGGLYWQNILAFNNYYSSQDQAFIPTQGPPILGSGQNEQADKAAISQDSASLPLMKTAAAPAPAAAERSLAVSDTQLGTETYREKTALQEPVYYYVAIAILSLMLFLNIFRVSFQTSAVFDSDIFKTLSSETRVEMLYALQERRKTLSELATEVKISLPGAKQHLALLEGKGLVEKLDEGRKWKYYNLTSKGRSIIAERLA
jgi:DNA-binding transcriptional ArsR family regulator